ncbi:MAG: hypothetical protein RLN70_12590, partial [Rhodospirillaceae bacterium]
MDNTISIAETVERIAAALLEVLQQELPRLGAGLALLILGWIVASILRAVIVRFARGLNQVVGRIGSSSTAARLQISDGAAETFGTIIFWAVLLLFITIAADSAGFTRVSSWLETVIGYFPTIFAGGLIILVGYLLSRIVRELIASALTAVGSPHGQAL